MTTTTVQAADDLATSHIAALSALQNHVPDWAKLEGRAFSLETVAEDLDALAAAVESADRSQLGVRLVVLGAAYRLVQKGKIDPDLRNAIEHLLIARKIRATTDTPLETKVLRLVFAYDRRAASAYAIVLRHAARERPPVAPADLPGWIIANKGLDEIRRNGPLSARGALEQVDTQDARLLLDVDLTAPVLVCGSQPIASLGVLPGTDDLAPNEEVALICKMSKTSKVEVMILVRDQVIVGNLRSSINHRSADIPKYRQLLDAARAAATSIATVPHEGRTTGLHNFRNRYDPTSLDEVVFPNEAVAAVVSSQVDARSQENLILYGPPGTGKTSVAHLIAKAIGVAAADLREVNAALDGSVEMIRSLNNFVMTGAFGDRGKVVVIDEVDRCRPTALVALAGLLDEAARGSVRFIMTTNWPSKIPANVENRCLSLDFSAIADDRMLSKANWILAREGFSIPADVLRPVIETCHGSVRKMMGVLEQDLVLPLTVSVVGALPARNIVEGTL